MIGSIEEIKAGLEFNIVQRMLNGKEYVYARGVYGFTSSRSGSEEVIIDLRGYGNLLVEIQWVENDIVADFLEQKVSRRVEQIQRDLYVQVADKVR